MGTAPLPGLDRLGSNSYLFRPKDTSPKPENDPDLIIVSAWMDAAPKHIMKYITGYQALYPATSIMVLTSAAEDFTWTSFSNQQKRLKPALSVLQSLPRHDRIILHMFSNGGLNTGSLFVRQYHQATARSLTARTTIVDSAPGRASVVRGVEAFSVGIPKSTPAFIRLPQLFLLYLVVLLSAGLIHTRLVTDVIGKGRACLNDETLFGKDEAARRLYAYSAEDKMVWSQDVESHADEAEKLGWHVSRARYFGSGHVSHMQKDSQRYWGDIKALWEAGSAVAEKGAIGVGSGR
ncbi:hypothetical protein MMC09_004628 [Bachmanniomyces sp. S44760]|nr:hypothetical protein [Bachmanniomyces sp. S44760]